MTFISNWFHIDKIKADKNYLNSSLSNNVEIFSFNENNTENGISTNKLFSHDVKVMMQSCFSELKISEYDWPILSNNLEAIKSSQKHLLGLIKYYEGDNKYYYESFTARYRDLNGKGTMTGGFGSTRKTNITTIEGGYKQLEKDLLLHGNEVIKKLGEDNWEKLPQSIREALIDLAFNKGLGAINKTSINNAINDKDWSSIIPLLKNVESSDKNSQAGLYRRCLSRSILALRNIKWPELSEAKTQVEKLYNEAYDFYTKNKISTADLEAVWSVYKKEFDDVKIINAESAKHKVVDGESYWSIASKYCPEGENVSDFVNLIKKYNRVPKDKNILGVGVLINIPLIFNEKKTNIEGVFTGSDIVNSQSSNTNSSNEKIVGNYSISASETEDFIIGEEYNGKGFYTVAKDIHAKYASPGFGITELSNKIGDLNKGVEFEVGAKITIPKIVKVEDNINTSIIENDEDKKEESDNTPIFKKMIDSGMSYTTGPIGAQGMNLKVLTFSYKLQESETLYGVAEKFDIDLRTLQEFNKISNKDAKTLQVGKEIKIPKVIYEVQSGDNLTKISQKFNLSQGTLMAMNNIELADQIKVQDKFALPGYVYTVKSGDNLTTIAKNAGISIDVLKTINGLTSTIIQPGQNLVILYNDMDYNVSSDNKITTYDDAGNKTGTQVNTGTNYTKDREYFTRDTDSKGNVVATRHVFQPTNNDKNAPLHDNTVVINAGHGYKPGMMNPDPGVAGKGGLDHECYINYDNAIWLKDELIKLGARVIFIQGHINIASKEIKQGRNNAVCLVSLHVNSGKPAHNRMEIFYNKKTKAGSKLAKNFESKLEEENDYSSEYVQVKESGFAILQNDTNRPAILFELGFMDHKDGQKYLQDEAAQKKNMRILAQSIAECF